MEVSAPNHLRRRTTIDNFFNSDAPHFIRVILEDHLRHKILRIPGKFVERHGGPLSDSVRLEVPTGRVWEVRLCRDDEGMYLRDGWASFLEDCRVGLGYLLLFRLEGPSRFLVVMFDVTTCEIKYPSRCDVAVGTALAMAQRVSPPGMEKAVKIEESEDDAVGERAEGGRKKPRRCSNQPSKRLKTRQSGAKIPTIVSDCSSLETSANEPDNGMTCGGARGTIVQTSESDWSVVWEAQPEISGNVEHIVKRTVVNGLKNAVRGTNEIIDLLETWQRPSTNESHGGRRPAEFGGKIADAEKSGAFLRASSFLCENVACVVRIRCLGCLHMSKKFLMACFPGRREFGDIVCVSESKSWTLGIGKSQCPRFRRGWTGFVGDNNLRIGDACVFELMDGDESKFRVVVFHEERAALPCLSPSEQRPSCQKTSTGKLASHTVSRSVNDSAEVECMDDVREERPFFLMVITPTSARHSVHVPAIFAKSHLPTVQAGKNVKASLKYKGLFWPVTLYSRECCGNAYTMIKGWQTFRKGNGFRLGDELRFELVDKNDLVFRVSISKDAEGQDCCDC